jgi:hypothetical protein
MNADVDKPSDNEPTGPVQRFEQQLAKDDEALEQLSEQIQEAERKSKNVIPDPAPEP